MGRQKKSSLVLRMTVLNKGAQTHEFRTLTQQLNCHISHWLHCWTNLTPTYGCVGTLLALLALCTLPSCYLQSTTSSVFSGKKQHTWKK